VDWIGDDLRTDAKKRGDLLANDKDCDARRETDDDRTWKHLDACSEADCPPKNQDYAR
jgi:hypothetical protein